MSIRVPEKWAEALARHGSVKVIASGMDCVMTMVLPVPAGQELVARAGQAAHMLGMPTSLKPIDAAEQRLRDYVSALGAVLGNDARRRGLTGYVSGLLLGEGRKSMEPIAGMLEPDNVSRRHQAIHHFVSEANWSDAAVRGQVRAQVLPAMQRCAPIEHLIIDDTPLHKSGRHSVGVAVQYSGRIRTTANCQALVSLSVSNGRAGLPVAVDLYLPEEWATDPKRRLRAGVPAALGFRTKPEIALDQVRWAVGAGLPGRVVLMDGAYGKDGALRAGIRALGLDYAAAVPCDLLAVPAGHALPGELRRGHGAEAHAGAARLDVLARGLEAGCWREVAWLGPRDEVRRGRFAALRVRTAPSGARGELGPEEWLLVQDEGRGHRRHWLVSLPADAALEELVRHAKGRTRIEQDYREPRQEVGFEDFEGRGWRGLNHHVTLCMAAHGFLVREQCLFPFDVPGRPVRPARHSPWSIASLRRRIALILVHDLPECPFCGTAQHHAPQTESNAHRIE